MPFNPWRRYKRSWLYRKLICLTHQGTYYLTTYIDKRYKQTLHIIVHVELVVIWQRPSDKMDQLINSLIVKTINWTTRRSSFSFLAKDPLRATFNVTNWHNIKLRSNQWTKQFSLSCQHWVELYLKWTTTSDVRWHILSLKEGRVPWNKLILSGVTSHTIFIGTVICIVPFYF